MSDERGIARKAPVWAVALAALVSIACLGLLAPGGAAAKGKPKYKVTVTRDAAGIPRIVGQNFLSLGYGEGFAFAQDNTCNFLDDIVTVRGQRSRFFGPEGIAYYYSNGTSTQNYKSDGFWKWVAQSGLREKESKAFSKNSADLYHGWVAGFNAYLSSGKLRDPNCKGKEWVRPINYGDLLARGLQVETGASSGNLLGGLYDAQPPSAARKAGSSADATPSEDIDADALNEAIGAESGESELGSNGLAFGSKSTTKGQGLLLANPHFPWRGVDRFWMAHLTVPHKYNMMGGTLGGFPMVGVGFNNNVAWTHTVSTGRRFVIRQLTLAPGDPTSYVVDGKTIPMTKTVVKVAGQDHTYYGTEFGLVVNIAQANYGWSDTTAYALTDTNLTNGGIANQYLQMGRAKSVKDLLGVLEKGRGIPFFNTIASDSQGNALYADVGRYSNVPQSLIDTCTPAGLPQVVYQASRVITLDGSKSSCTPNGLLPAKQMPRIIRRDYAENSNDSYWLANPKAPITGITSLIGLENTIQGVRTRYGNLAVQRKLDKGQKFGINSLQKFWESDVSYLATLVAKPLADLCTANPSVTLTGGGTVDISEACPILANYDDTGNLDSKGAWLFAAYQRRAPSGANFWSDPFNPADPLNTPNQLNVTSGANLQALASAVKELRDNGISLDSGMRGVQVSTKGKTRISIHGCGQCFQNINSSNGTGTGNSVNAPYGEVTQGSSLVMTTQLTKDGPRSEGILTYSQATDPTSPYFANMTKLFSLKQWVPLAFTKSQMKNAKVTKEVKLPGVPLGG